MIGDGGQSGFDVAIPEFRFHNFTGRLAGRELRQRRHRQVDLDGRPARPTAAEFYSPVISDPVVSKTMFAGTGRTAYRTKTAGLGTRTFAEAQANCNEWTGTSRCQCGDWAELGPTRLTPRPGATGPAATSSSVERTKADTSTGVGGDDDRPRVRVEERRRGSGERGRRGRGSTTTRSTPNRFVSSIYVDPANGNHAWISYSGYNVEHAGDAGSRVRGDLQPGRPGTSTWVDRSYDWGDLPMTDVVASTPRPGDLYASSDFGVSRLAAGTTNWMLAGTGHAERRGRGPDDRPEQRRLYAATHGLGAWP